MGASLAKLVAAWERGAPALRRDVAALDEPTFPGGIRGGGRGARHRADDAAVAFLWSAAENLVAAAMKAGPFGQLAGQRILLAAQDAIAAAATPGDDARRRRRCGRPSPGLAIASSRHETQYSRLFRS